MTVQIVNVLQRLEIELLVIQGPFWNIESIMDTTLYVDLVNFFFLKIRVSNSHEVLMTTARSLCSKSRSVGQAFSVCASTQHTAHCLGLFVVEKLCFTLQEQIWKRKHQWVSNAIRAHTIALLNGKHNFSFQGDICFRPRRFGGCKVPQANPHPRLWKGDHL